jgi:hypothetical protein
VLNVYPAIWEYQYRHQGALPDSNCAGPELHAIANELLQAADVNRQALASVSLEITESVLGFS